MRKTLVYLLAASLVAVASGASARTVTWSSALDVLTLDPHGQSVTFNNAFVNHIYEALVERDKELRLVPALATEWKALNDTTWEFKLRRGVKFHDGADFNADDVVFSVNRAKAPTSDYKAAVSTVSEVKKIDDYTVHIITSVPYPTLPNWLTTIYIMDKGWSEKNKVTVPQDFKGGEETYATRHANGTGPYIVKESVRDVATLLVANPNYWDKARYPLALDTLNYTPVKSAATRMAGLISGKIDFVLDPPLQDIQRVEADKSLKVYKTAEMRTMFLGFDLKSDTLRFGSGTDKNPFLDKRVRQAVYQAINIDGIKSRIMRDLAAPAGSVVPVGTHGYTKALDARPAFDPAAAQKLMNDAGYPNGFTVTLLCTNNRYINDEQICQALVPMLARIGIKLNLDLKPATQAFQAMHNRETSMFMLGFGVPTQDAEYLYRFILNTPKGDLGTWNFGNYSNPKIDALIDQMGKTVDMKKRDQMITDVAEISRQDIAYVPLHHQGIAWVMRRDIDVPIRANNQPAFKFGTIVK